MPQPPNPSPPSPPRILSLIASCAGSGHPGCAEKGDSSGGPGYSSCSGVSKETKAPRDGRGSEGRTVYRTISPLSRWGVQPKHGELLWSMSKKPGTKWPRHGEEWASTSHSKQPLDPTMAPGNWSRRRSGRRTAQVVRRGRLHGWDLPLAASVHVVVVVAVIQQRWVPLRSLHIQR